MVIFTIQLLLYARPWTLVPTDNAPDEKHFIKENGQTTICDHKNNTSVKVEILQEIDKFIKIINATKADIATLESGLTETYKNNEGFFTSGGIRFKVGKNTSDYHTAMEDCNSNNSTLMGITKDNFKTVTAAIIKQFPNNKNVWLPIVPHKQPTYKNGENIPKELCGNTTKMNLKEIFTPRMCGYMQFDTLTFSADDCTQTKPYCCKSNIQPIDLAEIILLREDFNYLENHYRNTANRLKQQIDNLTKTNANVTVQRSFIKQETIQILEDIKKSRVKENPLKEILKFMRTNTKSMEMFMTYMEAKEMNMIYSTSTVNSTTTTTNNTTTKQEVIGKQHHAIKETSKNDNNNLIIKYETLSNCKTYKIYQVYPIFNATTTIHNNVCFIKNICYSVKDTCILNKCHVDNYNLDMCCSNIFNKTTHDCINKNIFPQFYTQNDTRIIFSGEKSWINDTCGNSIYANSGKLNLKGDNLCTISSNLPFLTYPLKANFSNYPGGSEPTTIIDDMDEIISPPTTPLIHKILPYASTLASLFSGIMLIISLIICYRRRTIRTPEPRITRDPTNRDPRSNSWWCCCCNQDQANQQPQSIQPREIQLKPCLKPRNRMLEEETSFHSSSDSE